MLLAIFQKLVGALAMLISALTFFSIAKNEMTPQRLGTRSLNYVGTSGTFRSRICQDL